jgi:catechol 2,3-dioxygenase-like lactoylglutathione lyase family enzyme
MESNRRSISFIAADDADAAQAFFTDVLGLELCDSTPFALVFLDGDHVLRVQIVNELQRVGHTVHGWQVENIAREIAVLTAKGVVFQRFDQLQQDALGIWTTPNGDKIAWFNDPSGNTLSLTEHVAT